MVSTKKDRSKETKGYELTAEGEYEVATDSGPKRRFYQEKFIVPEVVEYTTDMKQLYRKIKGEVVDGKKVEDRMVKDGIVPIINREHILRCDLHYVLRTLLPDRMHEKYRDKGFIRIRKCEIVKRIRVWVPLALAQDISSMDIQDMMATQLQQFITFNQVIVDLNTYNNLADKKTAVARAWKKKQADDRSIEKERETYEENLLEAPEGSWEDDEEPIDLEDLNSGPTAKSPEAANEDFDEEEGVTVSDVDSGLFR